MSSDLIKIHKDITRVNIGILNKKELELFYYVCLNVKNMQDRTIELDFSAIKKGLELTNFRDVKKYILGLQEKLGRLRIVNVSTQKIETIYLFSKFTNDLKNDTLTIKVSPESLYFFNLAKHYLRFLFCDVMKLRGKYSTLLVPYLMDKSNDKKAVFERDRFFDILDVDIKYRKNLSDFNKRVIKPAVAELKEIFENLKVTPIKNGRTIVSYQFTWTNDFNYQQYEQENNIDNDVFNTKIIDSKPIDEIKEFWIHSFPGVNFTKKHSEKLEKMLQKNSVSYVKNYLKEQWEYCNNSELVKNKEAYFSSLILEEKAVPKDYIPNEHKEIKKEETMRLFEEPQEEKIEIKHLTEDDYIQTALFTETEPIKEENKIMTKEEYDSKYLEFLGENQDSKTQRSLFAMLMRKEGYQIQEKKVYTVNDIPEEQLLSKSGKKLVGSALQMRVDKILKEWNKGEK